VSNEAEEEIKKKVKDATEEAVMKGESSEDIKKKAEEVADDET